MLTTSTSEGMEQARQLAEMKRRVVEAVVKSGRGSQMTTLGVRRKAASLFYHLAADSTKFSQAKTRRLVAIYDRFGESPLRPQLERLFRFDELDALVEKTDDVVKAAIANKEATSR